MACRIPLIYEVYIDCKEALCSLTNMAATIDDEIWASMMALDVSEIWCLQYTAAEPLSACRKLGVQYSTGLKPKRNQNGTTALLPSNQH